MPGFLSFVRSQYAHLPLAEAPANMANEVYAVTGANTGLGFECAKHLVRMGAGRVILAVRSADKGAAALAAIRQDTGRADAGEVWLLDMASLASVEAFAKRLAELPRLDALVANAGVVMTQLELVENLERSLMVNVVATMLLACRTTPILQATAQQHNTQPRLVVVTSRAAIGGDMTRSIEQVPGDIFASLSEPSVMKGMGLTTQ